MSLKNEDLKGTISPKVSIDEFEPKAGSQEDTIVVAFYLSDEPPANDLNTFIQRGFIDTLDVEVSPNTDNDGNYLVFVEMGRNDTFPNKFQALLKDIENLTGSLEWEVTTYLSDGQSFRFNDPELFNYLILDPQKYITKDKFKMDNLDENIRNFLEDSFVTHLTIQGNNVILAGNNRQIVAEVIDLGDYDAVIGRNFLAESAFMMESPSQEAMTLLGILGNYQVLPIGEYLCVSRNDEIMLLSNTQIKYGK